MLLISVNRFEFTLNFGASLIVSLIVAYFIHKDSVKNKRLKNKKIDIELIKSINKVANILVNGELQNRVYYEVLNESKLSKGVFAKVVNVLLKLGVLKEHKNKLFGLMIDAERLVAIRNERKANSRYASFSQCQMELRAIEGIYISEGIKYLNVSEMSIEEISTRVLQMTGLKRRIG